MEDASYQPAVISVTPPLRSLVNNFMDREAEPTWPLPPPQAAFGRSDSAGSAEVVITPVISPTKANEAGFPGQTPTTPQGVHAVSVADAGSSNSGDEPKVNPAQQPLITPPLPLPEPRKDGQQGLSPPTPCSEVREFTEAPQHEAAGDAGTLYATVSVLSDMAESLLVLCVGTFLVLVNAVVNAVPDVPPEIPDGNVNEACEIAFAALFTAAGLVFLGLWWHVRTSEAAGGFLPAVRTASSVALFTAGVFLSVWAYGPGDAGCLHLLLLAVVALADHAMPAWVQDLSGDDPAQNAQWSTAVSGVAVAARAAVAAAAWATAFAERDGYTYAAGFLAARLVGTAHVLEAVAWGLRTRRELRELGRINPDTDTESCRGVVYSIHHSVHASAQRSPTHAGMPRSREDLLEISARSPPGTHSPGHPHSSPDAANGKMVSPKVESPAGNDEEYQPAVTYAQLADEAAAAATPTPPVQNVVTRPRTLSRRRQSRIKILGGGYCEVGTNTDLTYDATAPFHANVNARLMKRRFSEASMKSGPLAVTSRPRFKSADHNTTGQHRRSDGGLPFLERQNSCESIVSFVSFAASVTKLPGADQPRTFAPAESKGEEAETITTCPTPVATTGSGRPHRVGEEEEEEMDRDDRSIDLQSGWGQNFRPPPGLPKLSNSGEWGAYRPCSSSRSLAGDVPPRTNPLHRGGDESPMLSRADSTGPRTDRTESKPQVTIRSPTPPGIGAAAAPAAPVFNRQQPVNPMSIADARREMHELLHEDLQHPHDKPTELNQTAMLESLPQIAIYMIVNLISRLSEETDVLKVNNLIVAGVCEILKCDRASVFLVEGDSVRTFDDHGIVINVPMDKSLVGHAALTCKVLNIPDPYSDPRFNKDVDKETGYTTRNLLVYPITRDHFKGGSAARDRGCFAVIEAINKLEGEFSPTDETILALLGKQAGVLLSNSHMYHQLQTEMHKTATLLEVSREISDVQLDLGKVMDKIMAHARKVLLVERASVFLVDEGKKELWSILTDSEMAAMLGGDNVIRLPVGVGIAGTVAHTGNIINLEDAYHSSLFNPDFDRLTGFTTKACLCVPIRVSSKAGRVLGVMQFINKANGQPFGVEDEALAVTFSSFVGISLNNLLLYDELREGQLIRQKNKELVMLRDKAKLAAEAKANFLMSMSHEIRTPMSGVICMTELLETTALTPEQEEMVTTIRNCGESLLGIINDILDYGRLESGKMELEMGIIDLVAFCEHTMDVIRGKVEVKNISMHLLVSPNLPTHVVGDEFRLRQVLINLLGNAVKFTPNHGEIMLSVKVRGGMEDSKGDGLEASTNAGDAERPKATPVHVQSSAKESLQLTDPTDPGAAKLQKVGDYFLSDENVHIEFRVSDTGIGIPSEKHASLFLPFHQASAGTTRTYGGSGLGLSICKQIMEVMHGSISVASTVGKGSCFKIRAPFRRLEKVETSPMTFIAVDDMLKRNYRVRPKLRVVCASALDIQQQIFKEFFKLFDAKATMVGDVPQLQKALGATAHTLVLIDLFSLCQVRHGKDSTEELTKTIEAIARAVDPKTHLCILTTMYLKTLVSKIFSNHPEHAKLALLTTPPKQEQLAAVLETASSQGLQVNTSSLKSPESSACNTDAAMTPVSNVVQKMQAKAALPKEIIPKINKRLLVAEDNETNQLLIKRQLSQFGIEPKICGNGQVAIDSLMTERFDLIFMDCHMPVLDGYGASQKIRELEASGQLKGERIAIVALTADALPETRQYCLDAGMDDYVTKPIRKQVLKQVLDKWYFCTLPPDTQISVGEKK
eukprot:TRINITY_DN20021_c0_g1_i1.p1 TRINITY_DN20021_c0_g1~~TRINITY_DN20021_c0_g1_i1.p1  ORF type:complete len:1819 (+),score=662.83 TRINITY_DN20021_c0_g1_i1:95-5458(+)